MWCIKPTTGGGTRSLDHRTGRCGDGRNGSKLEDGTIVIIRLSSSSKTTPSRRALRVRVPQAMSQGLAEEIAMLLSSWLHASHSDWVHITSLSQIGSAVQLRPNVLNYSWQWCTRIHPETTPTTMRLKTVREMQIAHL
jgi:hypothetical protein